MEAAPAYVCTAANVEWAVVAAVAIRLSAVPSCLSALAVHLSPLAVRVSAVTVSLSAITPVLTGVAVLFAVAVLALVTAFLAYIAVLSTVAARAVPSQLKQTAPGAQSDFLLCAIGTFCVTDVLLRGG